MVPPVFLSIVVEEGDNVFGAAPRRPRTSSESVHDGAVRRLAVGPTSLTRIDAAAQVLCLGKARPLQVKRQTGCGGDGDVHGRLQRGGVLRAVIGPAGRFLPTSPSEVITW